ncbi:type II toxin-antitoxin system VapC family toxin [Paracoccus sp. (in: a-proteobacteria)]|uniref:type II toxin-antitoxin system VapC family toxin n=1 Tax=Paracoccus sp. TaxID=267 RepID=UPI0026E096F0|nr:type II toxin-antitoxin system VapC family toxin [Paracoccus sp. (in: a-proteobacteria)]MDO5648699.1 type II toxin-antitoxin system VapC family toxin [Paracoccus sp. (in: a-proteobacteria)]
MYVIDTNVISAVRRPDRAPQVTAWLRARYDRDFFLSAITIGDIERDICQQRGRDPSFAADLQGWLSHQLGHPGADLMIAATALHHGTTVVTGNVADFEPTGVTVENPF